MKPRRTLLAPVMAAFLGMAPTAGRADPPVVPAAGAAADAAPSKADTTEFSGIRLGSFLLFPEVVFAVTADDNIHARRSSERADTVHTLSPSLAIRSDWARHSLNFDIGADIDRYEAHSNEDVDDYWLGVDGSRKLGERSEVFGGLRFSRDHEDRFVPGTPGPDQQRAPTRYDHHEGHLGVATAAGPFRLRAGATYDRFDYFDGRALSGATIRNDDRRHDLFSVGARLGYVLSPTLELFVQYASDQRRYDDPIDGTTFNRDSDGYRVATGVRLVRPANRLSGELFVGRMYQDFEHGGFAAIDKPYFGGMLTWRPHPPLRISAQIDRVLEETTVSDGGILASASVDTSYGVEVERELSKRLSVVGRLSYLQSDYQGLDRRDYVVDAGAGVRYYVLPTVYLGADLRVIDRDSNDVEAQYSRRQLFLSIGYVPGRSASYGGVGDGSTGMSAMAGAWLPAGGFTGPYMGLAVGHGWLATVTSGPRSGGGSDISPMTGTGTGQSLFAGYGFERDRWYLGFEAEYERSQAEWAFSKGKDTSRSSSLERDEAYGVSLRAGHVAADGALLYARLGAVRSRLASYYAVNLIPAGAYDRSAVHDGVRVGIGADVPAGERVFMRMEYSYTRYGEYDAVHDTGAGLASEEFEPREGMFRIGLGYRFGGVDGPVVERPAVGGWYAGVHAGHGALDTRVDGRHSEAGVPVFSQPFAGEFGATGGVFGFFAGYGATMGRWYAGLELELDEARMDWRHERETRGAGGRDFAVEKKSDYGLALRVGYSLANGTLIYGRVGPVRARFNTAWVKGNNTDAHVDRTDSLDGMRYGLGAEIALGRDSFVRFDYTRTRYEALRFVTTHQNPDEMRFENRESLFRLGLGFRF